MGDISVSFFRSDGLSLAYEVLGEGPPVILVHGFASNRNVNWERTSWYEALADAGYRVVALDCRGHGESDKPRDVVAYQIDRHVRDVTTLMDHLGLAKAALMGYSMGARIVLKLLLTQPARATKVVLGGLGLPERDPAFVETVARAFEAPDMSAVTDPIARRFRGFAERQGGDLKALAACFRGVHGRFDLSEASRITVPVHIVVGENDDHVTKPAALAAAIPGARLVTIAGRDHMTVVGDPRFKSVVLEFLGAAADC
jgi:pimeloyl-ACP methyl ester carboxylesterase